MLDRVCESIGRPRVANDLGRRHSDGGQTPGDAADTDLQVRRLRDIEGAFHRILDRTRGVITEVLRPPSSEAFLRLVPSESSSGASRSQGPITKAGNGHARRLLVEAVWHRQKRYTIGKTMRDRWDLAPAAARARGDLGNRRLHARWVTFLKRNKKPSIANVAIARELAGWCLAVLEEN